MHPDCSGRYVNTAICRHHARKQRERMILDIQERVTPGGGGGRGGTQHRHFLW